MKLLIGKIMEDYEMTMRTIEYYKKKACEVAKISVINVKLLKSIMVSYGVLLIL